MAVVYSNDFTDSSDLDDFTLITTSGTVAHNADDGGSMRINITSSGDQTNSLGAVLTASESQIIPIVGAVWTINAKVKVNWPTSYFCLTNDSETFERGDYYAAYTWYSAGKFRSIQSGNSSSSSTDKPAGSTIDEEPYVIKIYAIDGGSDTVNLKVTLEGVDTVGEEVIDEALSDGDGVIDVAGWTSAVFQISCRRGNTSNFPSVSLYSLEIEDGIPAVVAGACPGTKLVAMGHM